MRNRRHCARGHLVVLTIVERDQVGRSTSRRKVLVCRELKIGLAMPCRQQMLTTRILMATVVLWTSRRVHANTVSRTKTCFTQCDIIGELSKLTIPR